MMTSPSGGCGARGRRTARTGPQSCGRALGAPAPDGLGPVLAPVGGPRASRLPRIRERVRSGLYDSPLLIDLLAHALRRSGDLD